MSGELLFGRFKVGQEVVLTNKRLPWDGNARVGERAIVTGGGDEFLNIKWIRGRDATCQMDGGYYPVWFDPIEPTLVNPKLPLKTRGGHTVLQCMKDGDRLKAAIQLEGGVIDLSFNKFGQFIPGHECKVDLINV